MAGSVDDIDLHTLIRHRHVLREDGDAALPFQVVVVQDEIAQIFGLAHEIGLIDHTVHEGGLAVVHVGDDRYVSDVLHILLKTFFLKTRKVNIFPRKNREMCAKSESN